MADSDAVRQRRYRARKRRELRLSLHVGEIGTGWPSDDDVRLAELGRRRFELYANRPRPSRGRPPTAPTGHRSGDHSQCDPGDARHGHCSECGRTVGLSADSAPPDRRRCRACQRLNPRTRQPLEPCPCLVCGNVFQPAHVASKGQTEACSRHCGGLLAAWRKMRPGEPFDREAMAIISAGRRQRRTVKCRERRLRHALTWDGITDEEILDRDGWRCQVPKCLYRSRKIDPQRKYPDPRSKGIDHVVPLSLGGDDTAVNKRAAHHGCNMARGNRMGDEQLALFGSVREPPRITAIAGSLRTCACGQEVPPRRKYCENCQPANRRAMERAARHQENLQLGEQIRVMKRTLTWQEISDKLGLSGPGRAYQLAVYYPKRQAQRGQVA